MAYHGLTNLGNFGQTDAEKEQITAELLTLEESLVGTTSRFSRQLLRNEPSRGFGITVIWSHLNTR